MGEQVMGKKVMDFSSGFITCSPITYPPTRSCAAGLEADRCGHGLRSCLNFIFLKINALGT
jgi:hypothetical protein